MENLMGFDVVRRDGNKSREAIKIQCVCLGRAASRDLEAMKRHIEKERASGFAVYDPPNVCKKSRYLLTNEDTIEVQERRSSSEAEYVLIISGGKTFVSAGSDVNDSTLLWLSSPALGKVFDSAKTKQACPAVVAREAWPYEDVRDHWDELRMRSRVNVSGKRIDYQDFPLSDLVDPEYYFRRYPWLRSDGTVMLSGSSNALPGVSPMLFNYKERDGVFPDNFRFEIHDPVLGRTISHEYRIEHLEWPDSDVSP